MGVYRFDHSAFARVNQEVVVGDSCDDDFVPIWGPHGGKILLLFVCCSCDSGGHLATSGVPKAEQERTS